jgi:hypothetical protein
LYTDQNPPAAATDLYLCDSDSSPNVEDYVRFSDFDFGLTSGVVIKGIVVHLNDVSQSVVGTGTQALKVRLSWDGGTSWTSSTQNGADVCTTPDITTASLNGAEYYCSNKTTTAATSDPTSGTLWGRTWTTSELTSPNFVVQVTADNSSSTARVQRYDVVEVKVYYAPTFTQNHYRWYTQSESENVTDPWYSTNDIAEDSPIVLLEFNDGPILEGTQLRLRQNLTVGTIDLPAADQQFKLQFKKDTDGSCTTGSWTDVGNSGSGAEWEYTASSVANSTQLTSAKLTGSDILQRYIRTATATANSNSATIGQDIEYDYDISHANASGNSTYSFRTVYVANDTIPLDTYTSCPTLTTAPATGNFLRHGLFFDETGQRKGMFWAR